MKRKHGFTLIELLGVIAILSIIVVIILLSIKLTTKDVYEKIDKITEGMILSAANDYTLEYRGTKRWKEESKADGAVFCISLDSLIDAGYFKKDESNYEEYREKYAVSGEVNSGIFHFDLVELAYISSDNICEYVQKEHMLVEKDEETGQYVEVENINKSADIAKDDKNLGSFGYNVTSNNNRYLIETNLSVKINEIIKDNSNVFVNILLDESRSISSDYESAVNSIISFSEALSNAGIKHSLIGFGGYPVVRRGYEVSQLSVLNFAKYGDWAFATNTHAAVDLTTSLIYNSKKDNIMNENSKIYTIIFTDGEPIDRLALHCYAKDTNALCEVDGDGKLVPLSMYRLEKLTGGYNLNKNKKAEKYFSVFMELIDGCTSPYNDLEESINAKENFTCKKENQKYYILFHNDSNTTQAWNYLTYSSQFLKSVGSKNIVVALRTDFKNKNGIDDIISKDDFCVDSSKVGYCYYDLDNSSKISELFSQFSDMFKELTVIDKVKLKLEPIVGSSDGVPFVTLYNQLGEQISDFEEIDLSSETGENLEILNKFSFIINETSEIFDEMNGQWKCSDDNVSCTFEGAKKLFDITLSLHYQIDDSWVDVTIAEPEFDLSLTKISTIN